MVGKGHELENLAARLDGGQDEVDVRCQEDEDVAWQGLLQGLQEGVGRRLVQALGVPEDEYPSLALHGPLAGRGDQFVELRLAVELAVGFQDPHVGVQAAVNGQAGAAAVAGIEAAPLLADQGLGKIHGEQQLVVGVGAGEDQAGGDAAFRM